jgi:tetratricopeptide (TPR) repeat protein
MWYAVTAPTIHMRILILVAGLIGPSFVDRDRSAAAQDNLPAVRRLIAETLKLCNEDRESNISSLNDLAAAQCYLGDFTAARKNLLPYERDNIFQQSAHQTCAQIEIELTGSTAEVPAALWNDGFGFMHCDAALAFIERGDIDKALQHIDEIPNSAHSAFDLSAVKLVQNLINRKQSNACRKVLLRWASCYEKTDSVFDYRDRHRVPQLVAWLVEFNERAAASLCQRWHQISLAETDIDECGEFIGRCWAEYALAAAALGDKDAASRALNQAYAWINKARVVKLDPEKHLHFFDFAQSYAAVAARQAVILGAEQSLLAYDRAYELARFSVNPRYGEYAYEGIVKEQLSAGDLNGARETIKRIQAPRSIARSWRQICDYELAQGNTDRARAAARNAVAALDRDGFEPLMAQEMAPVAASAALAGEKELAQRLFQRALALSERNETPKFNHSWIAGIQVHAGLLSDAYRTIQWVDDSSDRIRPLSALCRALAQAEYQAQKAAQP